MFKRIIFWSEFPEKVDWKRINIFLAKNNLYIEVYAAVNSKKNYLFWKKTALNNCKHITKVGAWPVLPKEKGYWFSGFTKKEDINFLDEFKGVDMKIDLELPLPKEEYSNALAIKYVLKPFFKKGKNKEYLHQKIDALSESSEILVNEFPLPAFLLNQWGISTENKKVKKNIMAYTTIAGNFWQPLARLYNFIFLKIKKPDSCSLGLIAPGIMKKEKTYRSVKDFEKDLKKAEKFTKIVAIYSLEATLLRKDPSSWFAAVKKYTEDQQPAQSH